MARAVLTTLPPITSARSTRTGWPQSPAGSPTRSTRQWERRAPPRRLLRRRPVADFPQALVATFPRRGTASLGFLLRLTSEYAARTSYRSAISIIVCLASASCKPSAIVLASSAILRQFVPLFRIATEASPRRSFGQNWRMWPPFLLNKNVRLSRRAAARLLTRAGSGG